MTCKKMKSEEKLNRILNNTLDEPFLIAEIGQSHDGSLGQAMHMIESSAENGADAVKFQTHIAEEESSKYDEFRVRTFPQDDTRYDYWKRIEFNQKEWIMLSKHAKDNGILFLSSPFSIKSVDILEKCNISAWKIASGELGNLPMIEKILETKKPMLISTGMSSWKEIDDIYEISNGRKRAIFQCTTEYPSSPLTLGLNNIKNLKDRYKDVVIGLSDHSGEIYPSIAAFTLGARIFEVHVTWTKDMFGPDVSASLDFDQLNLLSESLRNLSLAINNPVDKDRISNEKSSLSKLFGRGIYAKKDIKKGKKISFNDLSFLKPKKGVSAENYHKIIGLNTKKAIKKGEPIIWGDLT
tara:strand:+ start:1077 stop:2135 length:1059 start_codon:yes stop_codon:yes gene_type:complete